jgi:WD40 repeat protein/tetratricopeptide (TPR) repeat protein
MNNTNHHLPNPFPGLRPFRSDEHHLFFGREEQTAALLQLLRTNRFLAVVGTSGSGKSSLVRAGMIAELHGGTMTQAGSTWEVMILRPGGSPIENLARAFVDADLYDAKDASTLPRLLATLKRSRFGLVEAMKQSELFEPGTNLLVVVDQFEELFRFRQQGVDSEETAAAFVNLLLTASEQVECPIYVTITMRSDYLGDCSEIPGLAEAVNEGEYLIPRLARDQKRDAIEKPIGVGGAKISPLLVQRLLNEVGDDPDQLPVLQHALMRMWDAWSTGNDHKHPIDFGDFEATGGLGAALSNHADEIHDSLPDDRHRSACEKIFKTLTVKGDDNRGIRRPTRLAHLQAIAAADRDTVTTVLNAFRGSGVTFLMPGMEVELSERTVLDLSHESLMRGWQRLRGWVEEEAQSARIFRRLLDTARLWSDGKAGLFRDPDLQIALSWREQEAPNAEWAEQYGGYFEKAIGFLEASSAEAEAEQQAKEAARQRELAQAQELAESRKQRLMQQQRATRRLRKLLTGLAVVAAIAALACVAALIANQRANKLADNARQNEEKAKQSQQETEKALTLVESQKTELETQKAAVESSLSKAEKAEQVARAAEEEGRKLLYTTDMRLAPFVWRDDRTTAEQLRVLLAKHIPQSKESRDSGPKPDLRGFEWHYYQHLLEQSATVFSGHAGSVVQGALTPEGQLVTLDEKGQVRRWDLSSQSEDAASRRDLPGGGNAHRVLSPNGRLVALVEERKVHVFDSATGKETHAFDSTQVSGRKTHLIFSHDSDKLVIVDDKIRWCNTVSGAVIASFNQKFDRIESLAFTADGLTLAVVGHTSVGRLFSIFRLDATAKTVTPLAKDIGFGGTLHASALSPDGRRIAVGAKLSGALYLFDTATGRLIAPHSSAHASPTVAMAFSADGAKLVTADAEGTIKIWADPHKLTAKSVALLTLKGHQGAINAVVFSSDGKRLASVSADKTARVWDLDNAGAAIRPLAGNANLGTFVARFSSDGQLIALADYGSSVRLWDAATGRLVRHLPAADKGRIYSMAFSPTDSRLLAVGYGGQQDASYVALWDIDAGTERARLTGAGDLPDFPTNEASTAVGALAFSPDGKYLVAGFGSKNFLSPPGLSMPLKVWEVATRRLIRRLGGHTGQCLSLDFSSDGKWLASGSRDGTAILWSTTTWKATHTLQNPEKDSLFGGRGMVEGVAFSPNGKTLALASREGNIQFWDVAAGKLLATLKGHSSAVGVVVFSPDGRTLASGSGDQTVRLWNVETRRELMQLDPGSIELGQLRTLAFSPDGKQLLAGGIRSAFWSAAPKVWNDSSLAAAKLRLLLHSNADFQSRIRMLSENLRLHEALAKLDTNDMRVRAALAATQANWHASRQAWLQASQAFDRLVASDPTNPEGWLRTPGLLRLATALLHQDRPRDAAALLKGGAKRRALDGLPSAVDRVAVGVIHIVDDPATSELLNLLRTATSSRLAKEPRNPGLLELRAELAGQWSDAKSQVDDYSAAIDALSQQKAKAAAADLKRLYGRRGNAFVALKQWQQAVDDYARAVTDATTDDALLTNQALALSEVLLSSKRWTVLKPVEAKSELGATLSIHPDDSILAGGANPLNDRYRIVLTVPKDIDLAAVRLEALTHPSLPGNGPGRNRGYFMGSFGQESWNVTATLPDRKAPIKLEFDQAWADHQMIDHPINKYGHWNIAGYEGKNATAIWSMAKPVSLTKGTKLTFEMQCHSFNDNSESLGHFRLSVSSDSAAIEREQKFLALTSTDPWQKLAAAYQLKGDQRAIDQLVERRPKLAGPVGDQFTQEPNRNWQRAVEIYNKGITANTSDADLLSKRARAYEALKNWDAAVADWSRAATGNPEGAKLLAEFAQRLVAAGQMPLANGPFDKAQALYERSLHDDPENDVVATELAELLLNKHENGKSTPWKILQPTKMKSEGGATLTLQPDGSVLASGANPNRDVYSLFTKTDLKRITAIRLEALPDPSLPHNGPGRSPGEGNFHLNKLRLFSGGQPCPLTNIMVVHANMLNGVPSPFQTVIKAELDDSPGWGNFPRSGKANTAVIATGVARNPDDDLKIAMYFSRTNMTQHNLGRFRLSVSDDPAALEREEKSFAVLRVTDPWLKLAAGYALNGRYAEASPILSRLFKQAGGYEARKPILEIAAQFDEVLSGLVQRLPDDAQLQLALARNLAGRGRHLLAAKQPEQAQAELEKSRAILTRLRADSQWTVLTPIESKSQGGETLTVEKDGSIFVTGPNPNRAVYTLKLRTDLPTLTAIRLETIPDARLPQGGAGRYGNGNFHVSELTAAIESGQANAEPIPIEFGSAMADFSQDTTDPPKSIDGDPRTRWDTHPRMREPHWVVFVLKSPARMDGGSLRITLDSGITPWGYHSLGRFRLSATNDANFTRAVARSDLKDSEVADLYIALAKAHGQQGRLNEAVILFTEAFDLATDRAARVTILAEAAALEGVLERLAERATGDALCQAELARLFAERGNAPAADAASARARALLAEELAKEPENTLLAADLLSAYQTAGRTREAIPHLAKASAANPKDTLLSLTVAALEAWFGQEKELTATRQRIRAFAEDTKEAVTAERAAKACSILPSTDKAELEAVLALVRAGMKLGKVGESDEWNLLALGMAEYRSGNYAAAAEALLAAANAGPINPHITGTAAFYRAMSLFRQGKKDEARQLAISAAAKMKPLPADEQNPLTNVTAPPGGGGTQEYLILWLAYKEAKGMLKWESASSQKAENDKK